MLEALFLRQLRKCTHIQDELRDYDRLRSEDERRCYKELLATARRHLQRVRLQKHRDAMSSAIAGGNALASMHQNQSKGCKGDEGKGKGKDKGKKKDKGADGSQVTSPSDPLKGVCRFHLKGKCRAGNSCSLAHNPPCRFANTKRGCAKGDKCAFPHCRPAAAAAEDGSGAQAPSSAGTSLRDGMTNRK